MIVQSRVAFLGFVVAALATACGASEAQLPPPADEGERLAADTPPEPSAQSQGCQGLRDCPYAFHCARPGGSCVEAECHPSDPASRLAERLCGVGHACAHVVSILQLANPTARPQCRNRRVVVLRRGNVDDPLCGPGGGGATECRLRRQFAGDTSQDRRVLPSKRGGQTVSASSASAPSQSICTFSTVGEAIRLKVRKTFSSIASP